MLKYNLILLVAIHVCEKLCFKLREQHNSLKDVLLPTLQGKLIRFACAVAMHKRCIIAMRFLEYACRLYEKYMATSGYYGQSRKLQSLPKPHCLCFYNGTEEQPERKVLKLSEAFGGEGDIEVKVTMLNVNYGKNQSLLDACEPLREYAWLVEKVRQYQKITNNIEAAVDAAVDEMPDSFVLKAFLVANRAEVKIMFLTQYDEKKTLEMEREEGREEGRAEGEAKGRAEGKAEGEALGKTLGATEANERMATDMLKDGEPMSKIVKYSTLTEGAIRKLAKQLGVAVVM